MAVATPSPICGQSWQIVVKCCIYDGEFSGSTSGIEKMQHTCQGQGPIANPLFSFFFRCAVLCQIIIFCTLSSALC